MSKINNNRILSNIVFSLLILLMLAVGAIAVLPKETKAYTERYGYARPYSNDFPDTFNSPNYGGANAVSPESKPASTSNGSVLGASTTKTTPPAETSTPVKEEFSDLTANTVYGTNSFMPSGLIQWVILAIIILVIIILARKFFGREAGYHSMPLKHY